ncbi:phage tail protein [Algoriphagus sp. Y33]|uniref:phage tail protein n=1 Tax=Algoriphagus sp. Y33 TaxID=2772483 RepID=UPI00177B0584|nr:tail fiber protein [Algoriphagus sp. Y33]
MEGYISEIRFFGPNWAPKNWLSCQGQLLSVAQNQVLYSLIGTIYGGDGRTSFALPDLRGRVAVGEGQGNGLTNRISGQRSGAEKVTLTQINLPSHTHIAAMPNSSFGIPVNETAGDEDESSPGSGVMANMGNDHYASTPSSGESYGGSPVGVTGNVSIGMAGSGLSHSNEQPYLVLNPIICLYGIYPSRE